MTVAVNHVGVLLLAHERADFAPFVFEDLVGVIVLLVLSIRSDDWIRVDQDAEGRVGLIEGSIEPLFLRLAPDRLVRAVRSIVGGTIIASLHQPNLQIASPANRAKRQVPHGKDFVEDFNPAVPS